MLCDSVPAAPAAAGRRQGAPGLALAASAFVHAPDGMAVVDHDAVIVDVNDAFCAISGYAREEVLGRDFHFFQPAARQAGFRSALWRELRENGIWRGQIVSQRKDGSLATELLTLGGASGEDGEPAYYVGIFSDITRLMADRHRLERLAHFDALTGLPNRYLLMDRLRQMLAWAERAGRSVAICYLDLDGFKAINDSHGHHMGDRVLVEVGRRLNGELRSGDTVARLGGDEFVLLLSQAGGTEEVGGVLERLLACIARPIGDEPALVVSASIGVTVFPSDRGDADTLLRHADQAMYRAKSAGRAQFCLFDGGGDVRLHARQQLFSDANRALEDDGFCLHFQPKLDLREGRVAGFEALLRWRHPTRGLLLPKDFGALLDNPVMAARIDLRVLQGALGQMARWQAAGRRVSVSVNVSAHLLRQPDLHKHIGALLDAHPTVSPGDLQLEILETTLLDDLPRLGRQIKACRAHGLGIAIDDFGTGYSCLTWLKWIPAHILKIDRSFVAGMLDFPDDRAIVGSVLGLGRDFQRQIVAEGAETAAHVRFLGHLGCDLAQGFAIAPPMPAEEVMAWLDGFVFEAAWRPVPGEFPPRPVLCDGAACGLLKFQARD